MLSARINFKTLIILTVFIGGIINGLVYKWTDENWKRVITSDGKGYYLYLPATFIYHDFDYHFVEKAETDCFGFAGQMPYYHYENRDALNKYFCGVSILIFPFFIVSHFLAGIFGFETSGYSLPYQVGVSVAALFYLCAALWFLFKILNRFYKADHRNSLILLLTVAGSPLLYYSWMEPSMSHVYSFFLFCAFIEYTHSWIESGYTKGLIILGIIAGLIIAVRPTNAVILAYLPLFILLKKEFGKAIKATWQHRFRTLISLVLFFVPLFIQSLFYKLQVGEWWVYAYGAEGFNFTSPNLLKVLFSFRKGWFVYSPAMFIGALCLIYLLWKGNKPAMIWSLILGVGIYVISSWHQWFYGGSFGMRAISEYAVFFVLPINMVYERLKPILKATMALLLFCFLLLGLIQLYQVTHFILPMDEMTSESYGKIFLQTGSSYAGITEYKDLQLLNEKEYKKAAELKDDFSRPVPFVKGKRKVVWEDKNAFCTLPTEESFGPIYMIAIRDTAILNKQSIVARVDLTVKLKSTRSTCKAVVSVEDGGPSLQWYARPVIFKVNKAGVWEKLFFEFPIQNGLKAGYSVNFYLLKDDRMEVNLDDVDFTLWTSTK